MRVVAVIGFETEIRAGDTGNPVHRLAIFPEFIVGGIMPPHDADIFRLVPVGAVKAVYRTLAVKKETRREIGIPSKGRDRESDSETV